MKMTLIMNKEGQLLASMFGHASELECTLGNPKHYQGYDGPLATLKCQPDQEFREVEVPDVYEKLSPDELHAELRKESCR